MLRQSRDFKTQEDYQVFLDKIKTRRNFMRRDRIIEEVETFAYFGRNEHSFRKSVNTYYGAS
jgi:proline dehydrogenase